MIQPLYFTTVFKKLNIHLPHNSANILLGIYHRETKMCSHAKTYTQMFIAALFVIAPNWKQPKYL